MYLYIFVSPYTYVYISINNWLWNEILKKKRTEYPSHVSCIFISRYPPLFSLTSSHAHTHIYIYTHAAIIGRKIKSTEDGQYEGWYDISEDASPNISVYFYTATPRNTVCRASVSFHPLPTLFPNRVCPNVCQVIGCEMKSNENPFRRVHSRSLVDRESSPAHPPSPRTFQSTSTSASFQPHRRATPFTCPSLPPSPRPSWKEHSAFSPPSFFSACLARVYVCGCVCVSVSEAQPRVQPRVSARERVVHDQIVSIFLSPPSAVPFSSACHSDGILRDDG